MKNDSEKKALLTQEIEFYLTRIAVECVEICYMCEVRGIMAYVHLMTGVSSSMIIIDRLLLLLLLLSDGNIEIQRPLGFTKVSFVMLVCLRCVLADRICRQLRYVAVKLNMRRGDLMLHSETASRCYHPPACTRLS